MIYLWHCSLIFRVYVKYYFIAIKIVKIAMSVTEQKKINILFITIQTYIRNKCNKL